MSEATFPHDAFLRHSAKDKTVVRPLAERLRPHTPELQPSAFCLQPFPCAPLNQERRFISLRLDDAPITGPSRSSSMSTGTQRAATRSVRSWSLPVAANLNDTASSTAIPKK